METSVDAKGLDPALKNFLWEHAAKIADAVKLARAAGAGILTSALNEASGDLVRYPAAQTEIANGQTSGQKFFELLTKINLVVGLVGMPLAITADAIGLQPGMSSGTAYAKLFRCLKLTGYNHGHTLGGSGHNGRHRPSAYSTNVRSDRLLNQLL